MKKVFGKTFMEMVQDFYLENIPDIDWTKNSELEREDPFDRLVAKYPTLKDALQKAPMTEEKAMMDGMLYAAQRGLWEATEEFVIRHLKEVGLFNPEVDDAYYEVDACLCYNELQEQCVSFRIKGHTLIDGSFVVRKLHDEKYMLKTLSEITTETEKHEREKKQAQKAV